jgi:hypothetical protein
LHERAAQWAETPDVRIRLEQARQEYQRIELTPSASNNSDKAAIHLPLVIGAGCILVEMID